MTAAAPVQYQLADDELQLVAHQVGIQTLPTVLAIAPRHNSNASMNAAFETATRRLTSRELIVDDTVEPDLENALLTLQRPDRELAMRLVTPDGMARVSVVRRGQYGVAACRVGDQYTVRTFAHPDVAAATRVLLAELPRADAAVIDPVGAPLSALAECLDDGRDGPQIADGLRALGAESRAALLLGSAMASRLAFAEIVYYAIARARDRIERGPAAVAVFYTKRGRIVASPTSSPAGQLWTTVKGGSDHAIAQAVGQLVGLSNGRWEDP